MSIEGVDFDRYSTVSGATLAAHGYSFVINHLGGGLAGYLTTLLAVDYTSAGVGIVSVYESTARLTDGAWLSYDTPLAGQLTGDASTFGYRNGFIDGHDAYTYAANVHQTPGSAIYFIADPNARAGITYDVAYFRGVADAFTQMSTGVPAYAVGVYGSGTVLDTIHDAGLATYRWLAAPESWQGSSGYTGYDIAQYGMADLATFPGQMVVHNRAADNSAERGFGQWTLIATTPNLAISALGLEPTIVAGDTTTISIDIRNLGTETSKTTNARVYLSADGNISAEDTLLSTFTVPPLTVEATAARTMTVTIPTDTPTGVFYVGVVADPLGNETMLSDNSYTRAVTVTVEPSAGPNLVVNYLTLRAASAAPGGQVTVDFEIGNAGRSATATSTVRVYLSADGTIGANDTLLGSFAIAELDPNMTAAGSLSVIIPQDVAVGNYNIGVVADAVLGEVAIGDNAYAIPFTVGSTIAPVPDLVVNYLALRYLSVSAGGQEAVEFEVGNIGTGAADTSTARIFLSADATVTAADTLLGAVDLPALDVGAAATRKLTVAIPDGTAAGTWYIGVVGSPIAGEIITGNNSYAKAVAVTQTAIPKPNLVINDLVLSVSAARAGDAETIDFEVGNAGTAPAGATTARVYISADATISASDTLLGAFALPALGAGGSATRGLSTSIPAGAAPGKYYIGVVTDAVADEASLNDNAFARSVTVMAPAGTVSISDVTVTEGDSGTKLATFVVTRSGGTAAFDVHYTTADGGADVADGDYNAASGTLRFGDGVGILTISVAVNGDTRDEAATDQTFHVNLSTATAGATIANGRGVATILDDDQPNRRPMITVQDVHVRPSGAVAAATMITSASDPDGDAITRYAFRDAGSGGGYFSLDGVAQASGIWIPLEAADLSKMIYFGSNTVGAETLEIGVFDGSVWSASATVTATTQVDDSDDFGNTPLTAGGIGASGVITGEIEQPGDDDWFAATLTAGVTYRFDLQSRASDIGALATPRLLLLDTNGNAIRNATDLSSGIATVATLSFLAPTSGAYYLAASGVDGAIGTYGLGVAALSPTLASVAALDASKPEGSDGATKFTFAVSRSGVITGDSSIEYTVTGNGLRPANAADFAGGVLPHGIVHFLAGENAKTISIDVAGDAEVEASETFTLALRSLSGDVVIQAGAASVGGTILPDDTIADLVVVNSLTGEVIAGRPRFYDGPVGGLEKETALITPDNVNVAVSGDNWFIRSGAGTDALAAHGGRNILDGGTGSNFLTGGAGEDTFFLDTRAPSDIWSTVVDFGKGDSATLWGVTQADFTITWLDKLGALGFEGLTMHAVAPGKPDAMLTFADYTRSDLDGGRLQVAFGAIDPSSPYLYVYCAS